MERWEPVTMARLKRDLRDREEHGRLGEAIPPRGCELDQGVHTAGLQSLSARGAEERTPHTDLRHAGYRRQNVCVHAIGHG